MHIKLKTEYLIAGYGKGTTQKVVLDSINLTAEQGNLIALTGKNGVGKSTFLKTVVGLIPRISGNILINQIDLQDINNIEKSKLISFAGTGNEINKSLKVKDFVALGRFPYTNVFGTLKDDDFKIINQSMEDTRITHLAENKMSEISDGEFQRTQIARTLAQDTPIILLDEPTAYLDMANKFEMTGLMRRLSRNKNKIIIFSTHDLYVVLGTVDIMWLIDNKTIISEIPEELVLNGKLDNFFDNTQTTFDIKNNKCRLNFTPRFNVKLAGEPSICNWTEKALNRLDIACIDDDLCPKITVSKIDNYYCWQFSESENNHKFNSLKELLKFIHIYQLR